MFRDLRDSYGRYTGLASGLACFVLAGLLAPGGGWLTLGAVGLGAAGAGLIVHWWPRHRAQRYDLNRLWERDPEPEEPWEDTVPHDEGAAPYCGWCDEANPPGVRRCVRCGRELG